MAQQMASSVCADLFDSPPGSMRRQLGRVQIENIRLPSVNAPREVTIPRSGALILQRSGSSEILWRTGGVRLGPLEWAVVPGSRIAVKAHDDGALLVMHGEVAESNWSRTLEITRAGGHSMGGSGMGQVAGGFLTSLADAADTLPQEQGEEVSRIALQLVRSAAWENRDRLRGPSSRHVLLTRAQEFIARQLSDPDLSVERIATALNCTKRYVHKAFSDSGETVAAHIWRLRLERCRDDLVKSADRPITDIAFGWGFNSSSHFSRLFRERFGKSPRNFRTAARAVR